MKLNLGGRGEEKGFVNIDLETGHDLDKPMKFKDESVEEIISNNLLEHLTNIGQFLSECFRILKKDGRITVITDNANYWGYILPKGVHRGGYESYNNNDKHYCLFTDYHLKNHLRKAGFKDVKVEPIGFDNKKRVLILSPRLKIIGWKK